MIEISEEEYNKLLEYKKLVENAVFSYIVARQIVENNIPLPKKKGKLQRKTRGNMFRNRRKIPINIVNCRRSGISPGLRFP